MRFCSILSVNEVQFLYSRDLDVRQNSCLRGLSEYPVQESGLSGPQMEGVGAERDVQCLFKYI